MWWLVVFQILSVIIVEGLPVVQNRPSGMPSEVNCVDYTKERFATIMNEGWPTKTPLMRKILTRRSLPEMPAQFVINSQQVISRRMNNNNFIDNLIPRGDYLVKEHAKLVHDINSLRQVVFVRPFVEENKDYDDSIFHEIIDVPTSTSRTPLYNSLGSTIRPYTTTKSSSIPVILIGGASQRQVVTSQPINFMKPTVSLIGTTVSPVIKHPYPFVKHRKPVKICVTSIPSFPTAHPPPKSVWERIIDYFIPRRNFGR